VAAERITITEGAMGIPLARIPPRSTATPRWGWSGVEVLSRPSLSDDQLTKIIELLPTKLLAREEIKMKIFALGARYHRYLHQDEFGPTRAERMSALRSVLAQLEQLELLISELPQQVALDLMRDSNEQPFRMLDCWRDWTIEQICLAANLELSGRHAKHSAAYLNLLERICITATVAIELVHSLDTSSEGELWTDATSTRLLIGKDARGIDVFCIGEAPIGRLMSQFRLTIDRLRRRRGPEKQASLPLLVWQLCDFWTEATGLPVTNCAVRNGNYTSRPESAAGKFILAIVEALQPPVAWITRHLRSDADVRAEKFAVSPGGQARTVGFAMRDYVAHHQRSGVRRRGRPRTCQ
jgi:hypothetical protein